MVLMAKRKPKNQNLNNKINISNRYIFLVNSHH